MSRRKQARPIKLLEDGSTPSVSAPGESSGSCSEDEGGTSAAGDYYGDLGGESCKDGKDSPGASPGPASGEEGEEDEKREEEARRQDAENNNSVEEGEGDNDMTPLGFPFPGHVTLEALQNTKVAVAQFAATAMANNADNTTALQELAVLQSALYTLQQQQVLQLNLIQQLQQQLQITRTKEGSPSSPSPVLQIPKASRSPTPVKRELSLTPPASQSVPPSTAPCSQSTQASTQIPVKPEPDPPVSSTSAPTTPSSSAVSVSLPPCSISSSFASSIITNLDPPPSPSEPNTLEMLQRRAQEVLDNASQGLLANNLADELAFRKNGGKGPLSPYDSKNGRNEPFFKHRCRYCGKVFGSDSALQIHIRSHTGERPFKCNVCGSRFTTKGNLKVHFQRHTAKFPHIKMNPNPVPEHLDKYHPPLLSQMGAHQSLPPGVPPPPHPGQFPTGPQFPGALSLYRPPPSAPHDLVIPPHSRSQDSLTKPVLPLTVFGPRVEQDVPENLSKSSSSPRPSSEPNDSRFKRELDDDMKDSLDNNRLTPKHEIEGEGDMEGVSGGDRYPSPPPYDDCSYDSKYTDRDEVGNDSPGPPEKNDDSLQEQPENLSNKSMSDMDHFSLASDLRFPVPPIHFPNLVSPASSVSSGSAHRLTPRGFGSIPPDVDPAKDPAIYSNLLPRPGSTDNSWESLIEIDKSNETTKLQALVDNIEHKITDPNQCIICQRVLSCKSALQMHYRTHTGERPFKCKICGRAFTTKGNLKTHMGVHRIKPPVRTLHQCPVCHKKFTNGLVLQQHIRLHTGEPTDLTPEQIQAAEIKDYLPSQFPIPPPHPGAEQGAFFPFGLPSSSPFPKDPPSAMSHRTGATEYNNNIKEESKSDLLEENRPASVSPISDAVFSNSIMALEDQIRSMTTMSSQNSCSKTVEDSAEDDDVCNNRDLTPITVNGEKSPAGSRSPSGSEGGGVPVMRGVSSGSPGAAASPESALDLRAPPAPPPGPTPPPALFPGFPPLLPASIGATSPSPLITSALSSLTSSVLNSTAFNPLALSVAHTDRRFTGRGNTTCQLCFKTFACNSALEIHYRSHTKERPFKCSICDRGFSTKGNMKQHMLTHKIRDMPPHLFDQQQQSQAQTSPQPTSGQTTQTGSQTQASPVPPPPTPPIKLTSSVASGGGTPLPPPAPPSLPPSEDGNSMDSSRGVSPPKPPSEPSNPLKRSPPQSDLPLPKRQPSLPKHLCNVCNKNFSSSSALQIHMRTHTGDKPFRCTICHKAFTTKGNLKVHMGTHMWTNGASRRGRRMSLELPPLQPPKDSEFLHRRPDLFYPYLPAPFLNGIHHKLGEMALPPSGGGPNGFLSYSNFMSDYKSEPRSPDKGQSMSGPLWDLPFSSERKGSESVTSEECDNSPPPTPGSISSHAGVGMPPPTRSEGLAA